MSQSAHAFYCEYPYAAAKNWGRLRKRLRARAGELSGELQTKLEGKCAFLPRRAPSDLDACGQEMTKHEGVGEARRELNGWKEGLDSS